MNAWFFALSVVAAGLAAGCAAQPGAREPGPAYVNEMKDGRPGLFGDLTWNIDISGKQKEPAAAAAPAAAAPASAAEAEEFKKWRESAGQSERSEFEEWRAWQEWKRKNPK
jgi:hypothetical protein